jgi:hypothetical protein
VQQEEDDGLVVTGISEAKCRRVALSLLVRQLLSRRLPFKSR